jgi:hypothetical protein
MNSHVALYLAEARQAELRSTAARTRAAAIAGGPSWADRFRAAVVGRQRQSVGSTTLSAPAGRRASTTV